MIIMNLKHEPHLFKHFKKCLEKKVTLTSNICIKDKTLVLTINSKINVLIVESTS